MRKPLWISLLLVAGLTAVAMAGVSVEYSSQTDFSRFRSYSWAESQSVADRQFEQVLHRAVDRELLAKGLERVDEGGDILVRIRSRVSEERRSEVDILGERVILEEGVSGTSQYGERMRDVDMEIIAVELLDGHSRLLVWQGVLGALAPADGGRPTQKRVDKLIGKIFKKYPPR